MQFILTVFILALLNYYYGFLSHYINNTCNVSTHNELDLDGVQYNDILQIKILIIICIFYILCLHPLAEKVSLVRPEVE